MPWRFNAERDALWLETRPWTERGGGGRQHLTAQSKGAPAHQRPAALHQTSNRNSSMVPNIQIRSGPRNAPCIKEHPPHVFKRLCVSFVDRLKQDEAATNMVKAANAWIAIEQESMTSQWTTVAYQTALNTTRSNCKQSECEDKAITRKAAIR